MQHFKVGTGTISQFDYTVGRTGQRLGVAEDIDGVTAAWTYTYDGLGRLYDAVRATEDDADTWRYRYDRVGNRVAKGVDGATTTYTYNDLDQLVTEDDGTTVYTYTYDANGNQTQKTWSGGEQNYLYDSRNRLKRVYDGAVQGDPDIAYGYDYAQNRVARAVPATGETVRFLIDENNLTGYSQTLLEFEDTGQVAAKRYDFADDLLTQIKDPTSPVASTSHLLYDALGSTRSLTTEQGGLGETYAYTPFGSPLDFTLNGNTATPHLFAGEWFDAGTGYSYNRTRYYDTGTGRFTATDPVEDEGNRNHAFNYCAGDPINNLDPSGMSRGQLVEVLLVAVIVGILAGLALGIDATLDDDPNTTFVGGFVEGFVTGVGIALLIAAFPILAYVILPVFAFLGGVSVGLAINDGNVKLAIWRVFVLSTMIFLVSKTGSTYVRGALQRLRARARVRLSEAEPVHPGRQPVRTIQEQVESQGIEISDDAMVHFAPRQYGELRPPSTDPWTFRYGDIKEFTPGQVESIIGPMAEGGKPGGTRFMHVADKGAQSTYYGRGNPIIDEYSVPRGTQVEQVVEMETGL